MTNHPTPTNQQHPIRTVRVFYDATNDILSITTNPGPVRITAAERIDTTTIYTDRDGRLIAIDIQQATTRCVPRNLIETIHTQTRHR